jgi:hypothetical protein
MTQPIDIVSRALKDIGALEAGETPTSDAAQDAFDMLNDLIDQWSNEQMMVFYKTEIVWAVTQNVTQYTIGPGGSIGASFTGSISGTTLTIPASGLLSGYITLGQPAPQLSGGEAQRVKLSKELSKRATGRTLYILDEPTTGLHFEDTRKLLEVLQELVEAGNTIVVIEHNLDVIKVADYLLDFGPEGGDGGGEIVAVGTPEQVAENKASWTGKYLKEVLDRHETRRKARVAALGQAATPPPAKRKRVKASA